MIRSTLISKSKVEEEYSLGDNRRVIYVTYMETSEEKL